MVCWEQTVTLVLHDACLTDPSCRICRSIFLQVANSLRKQFLTSVFFLQDNLWAFFNAVYIGYASNISFLLSMPVAKIFKRRQEKAEVIFITIFGFVQTNGFYLSTITQISYFVTTIQCNRKHWQEIVR